MREVELKAKVADLISLEHTLLALGATFEKELVQKDRIFTHKYPRPENSSNILRIREQEDKYYFTLKSKLNNSLDNIEKEVTIDNPSELADLLGIIDFEQIVEITKTRKFYKYKTYTVCLDQVEGLGEFIEIEAMVADDDTSDVQSELKKVFESLGILEEQIIMKGYTSLMLAHLDDTKYNS